MSDCTVPMRTYVDEGRPKVADDNAITDKAVKQLKAYAKYIDEHAENIIGNIDKSNWVTDGGIRMMFTLMEHDSVPTLTVEKEYIVLDAVEVMHDDR